ncbi:DNA/RNA non-specific endonuclease [Colletotrichum salicis]|uniref:Endonuclease n=1 Tax=Colletotrichum salicis TaxID=1209931 RepID=A0A135S4V7_9PEZI|nr:DNA/RNA non-specific endonuclease [Colletotrichum salicis]
MSKTTSLALMALGAGGGAALTASIFSMRSQKQPPTATTTTTTTTSSFSTAPSVPVPSTQVFTNPNTVPLPPAPSPYSGGGGPVASNSPVDPAGLFEYGFPGPVADLATRQGLVSSYDRRTRNPHWVVEHITPASLAQRDGDRKHSTFVEDASVPEKFQAKLKDYFRSGYDRGHQVPAADCKWSQKAMDDTFYLTNMCPQVGDGFNRDYWAHFEDFCRRLTTRYPSVRIVTGPLYLPKRDPVDGKWYTKYEVIGNPPNVAVPTHFYKIIFAEDGKVGGNVAIGAFVMPNAPIPNSKPLSEFEMPLEAVERAAGLEFASKLAPQRRKRLCTEASCAIVVKEYADRQKQIGGGGKGRS